MAPIGEMLRQAREAQGLSLADMATELCITQRYLRAIEEDDVAALPGSFFFVSFARQYATLLGLDKAKVSAALAVVAEPSETSTAAPRTASPLPFSRFHSPSPSTREFSPVRSLDPIVEDTNRRYFAGPMGRSWVGLAVAVLIGSGIFAWWTRPPQTARVLPPATVVAPAPVKSALPAPSPVAPTSELSPAGPQAPSVSTAPGTAEGISLQAASAADDGKQVTLNLSATERTWLSITSHGKVIFSGILEPSQSKTLQGSEVATMKIGNAAGVDVQWNGKSIGPIGARGQVRTIRFTREDFKILEPESPDQL